MTTMAMAAVPPVSRRPIPWKPMARATWIRNRSSLLGLAGLFGTLGIAIVVGELALRSNYGRFISDGCVSGLSGPCANLSNSFANSTSRLFSLVEIALHVLPVLIGVFIGAPLLARELESGTFRFTWTQGVGRTRFVLTTFVLLAVAVVALCGLLGFLLSWFAHPLEVVGVESRWESGIFDTSPLTLAAWGLLCLALGTFFGALIKKVVPAMAATAVVAGGVLVGAFVELDHHLFAIGATARRSLAYITQFPGTLNQQIQPHQGLPSGGWLVNTWLTGPGGIRLSTDTGISDVTQMYKTKLINSSGKQDYSKWLSQHHLVHWVSFQPASAFWAFQGIEMVLLVGLAALVGAATLWVVRRG
jgi:hypothetical protein